MPSTLQHASHEQWEQSGLSVMKAASDVMQKIEGDDIDVFGDVSSLTMAAALGALEYPNANPIEWHRFALSVDRSPLGRGQLPRTDASFRVLQEASHAFVKALVEVGVRNV